MIPIPPLDGGRVAVGLLPGSVAYPLAKLERFGFLIIIGLLIVLPMIGDSIGIPLEFVSDALQWVFIQVIQPFIAISAISW